MPLLLFISIFAAAAALSVEYRKSADPLRLSITGGVVTVSGAFTYFFINRMVLYFAKPAERGYLKSMIHIGDELYVYRFAAFVYEVLFADVPYLNSKVLDFAGENWGAVTCVQIKRASKMIEIDQLRYEWDCSVAQDVAEKAKKLSGENNVKIKVFGKKEYPPPENSRPGRVIGHSVYSWEESGYRMVAFIRDIGFKDISDPTV